MPGVTDTTGDHRARLRERIATAARRGTSPGDLYGPQDLEFAFGGQTSELRELEEIAADVQKRKRLAGQVRTETERVLQEWQDVMREAARAEARRRLGLDKPTPSGTRSRRKA